MATFYTDSGSFAKLDISGSGQDIFTVSGSGGALLDVSDLTAGANVFQISSASIDVFTINQNKIVNVSGSLQVTGSLIINGTVISANAHRSYYENLPIIQGTTAVSLGGSSMYFQPFLIPYDISISYIRMPITNIITSQTIVTTNNTSITMNQSQTFWFNIYSAGNGLSSRSLQYYTQASATMLYQIRAQQGAATANQTVSHNISYFGEGLTTNAFATNYSPAATNIAFSTTHLTAFTGFKWLDIPFNTSLASGQWWIGLQRSSATAITGPAALSTLTMNNSYVMLSQISANPNLFGANTSAGTNAWQLGLGLFTTNTFGFTSVSVAFSQISTSANQPRLPFQFIRQE